MRGGRKRHAAACNIVRRGAAYTPAITRGVFHGDGPAAVVLFALVVLMVAKAVRMVPQGYEWTVEAG